MNRNLPALMTLVIAMVLCAQELARAISTDEDVVGNATSVFRQPAPFSAARPPETDGGAASRLRDLGPGLNESPEQAPIGAFPWVVALVEKGVPPTEGYICAGVLVASNWVLTAAHCTTGRVPRWPVDSEFNVLIQTSALVTPGPTVTVTKIVPHPDYNARTQANDLALLKVDGAKGVAPLRLEGPPVKEREGAIAQILAWGVTNKTLLVTAAGEHLQILQAAIVGERCFSPGNYRSLRGTGVFCAESLLKFHDTCYRFGGGPVLLHDAAGERYLGGLVSWSSVCPPDVRKPNIYLDVQYHLPWIKGIIGGTAGATP